MTPRDRLARLHFVNALFHRVTGNDLYLASQMLSAIEAATSGDAPAADTTESRELSETLRHLYEGLVGGTPDTGFAYCDGAAGDAAGPLWLRAELLSAVRRNAAFPHATIMVGNLDGGTGINDVAISRRSRAAEQRAQEHAETVEQLRELAASRANPRSNVTLLFV